MRLAAVMCVVLLSGCGVLRWDAEVTSSRDFQRLTQSPSGKAAVIAELQAVPDNARMNSALLELLMLQKDYQEDDWQRLLPTMSYDQRLHMLDVMAQQRLNVIWQDPKTLNP